VKKVLLIAAAFGMLVFLYRGLFVNPAHEMPSALLNKTVPGFALVDVLHANSILSAESFGKHPVSLLNIWATWCHACRYEHKTLMMIKETYHVPIYGIAYKDDREAIGSWLNKRGNPYEKLGIDNTGDVVLDFGIYGTPETFLIDKAGRVLYRHVGALTDDVWRQEMLPIIERQ
jgi:cytochrome c biogenesis protein CcmG/thiol:disulfide interchange protein DsbE